MKNTIAIIDLGGQYCHLIVRRLRDLGVRSHIYDPDTEPGVLAEHKGMILSGGPQSVYEKGALTINLEVLRRGVPILGICYGHQLLAQMLGAKVEQGSGEYGHTELSVMNHDTLFTGTPKKQTVWMSHSDTVTQLPPGLITLASTEQCQNAAFVYPDKRFYGVQFHPEVVHTQYGEQILKNFSFRICSLRIEEGVEDRVEQLIKDIKAKVGNKSVFFLLSGGVDSTVAFVLCAKALPKDRILGLHVDTGLMRKGETDELRVNLETLELLDRLQTWDASTRFLEELREATDPEEKRQTIGRLFVEVQAAAMRKYGIDEQHWLLGQGTIYPDTIESGGASGRAAVIKTHHNRCAEIIQLIRDGRVVEPLADLYKDEVRRVGRALGLDPKLTNRWPFPGPGLAIRCLCRDSAANAEPLDPELARVVSDFGYEGVLLPVQSVGVQGDARTYRRVVAVCGRLDYQTLQSISTKLCNVYTTTNRVIALIHGCVNNFQTALIKPEKINAERIAVLREADFITRSIMNQEHLTDDVWQFPVILVPVSFCGGETIVLRPVNSKDGMTANFAKLRIEVLQRMAKEIMTQLHPAIDAVFLDVTSKPPATIEWE